MARKHEKFSYSYGYRTAPEQWRFYLNGKMIQLELNMRVILACLCLSGREKEAEDRLKQLLRKKEKKSHDYVTFGFFAKESNRFYYTKKLKAHGASLLDKLYIYKKWKRYIVEDCNGYLQPFRIITKKISPYGIEEGEGGIGALIDTDRRGVIIHFVENVEDMWA